MLVFLDMQAENDGACSHHCASLLTGLQPETVKVWQGPESFFRRRAAKSTMVWGGYA